MEIWLGINSDTGYCCRIFIRNKFDVEFKSEAYGENNPENLVQSVMSRYRYKKIGQPQKLPRKLKDESIDHDMGATNDFSIEFDTVQQVAHMFS